VGFLTNLFNKVMIMTKQIEYAVIKNAVDILCLLCAAPSGMVIDALTGILWDEEEAEGIKSYGK